MKNTPDFSPFHRSSIGFDRVFDLLENASRAHSTDAWPPYDIMRIDDNAYRIVMAVAGLDGQDLEIMWEPNLLIVTGEHKEAEHAEYLHRGLAARPFIRRFELADHVEVAAASINNGLLSVDLRREVPEAMKPRRVEIVADRPDEMKRVTKDKIAA